MSIPVVMPQLGESVVEGVVTHWRVQEGDLVQRDQPLCDVETDKAESEVPSPARGRVTRLLAKEGETVATGRPILELDEEAGERAAAPPAKPGALPPPSGPDLRADSPARPSPLAAASVPTSVHQNGHSNGDPQRLSPVVRRIASERGVDLSKLHGTGEAGRVTKRDLLRYLGEAPSIPGPQAPTRGEAAPAEAVAEPVPEHELPEPAPPAPSTGAAPGDRVVPFSRRRRLIAERMVASRRAVPDVTCVCEIDLARVAALRKLHAARAARAELGPKLTYLPFVCEATVRALGEIPLLNATVGEDRYTLKAERNLGIAVDTEAGLVVPVLRHADELSLVGLARAAEELARRAREGRLTPDELAGGTFTLSNPGPRGNLFGTPIILQPQVGILRMGEVVKRPVVVELDGADAIAIRPMMHLALTYDHRIVDGVTGNGFLRRVKELLEAGEFQL
ncbi:MAG: dihydrolipoamide acetyltransferase family protein [Deltaproteobacteria bacterium]